jgi:anti-sigma B factor antagonist
MTLEKSLGSDLFQIDVSHDGIEAVVTLTGELDVASAPELVIVLQDGALDVADTVELDMERVSFVDSTGIGVLVSAHRRMNAHGRTLIIRSPQPPTVKLIQISGLSSYLNIKL